MAPVVLMLMHVDNQAAISQLEGEASSIKAKHIDVRRKYLRDLVRHGIFTAQHVRSELMIADLMTKALDATKLAAPDAASVRARLGLDVKGVGLDEARQHARPLARQIKRFIGRSAQCKGVFW